MLPKHRRALAPILALTCLLAIPAVAFADEGSLESPTSTEVPVDPSTTLAPAEPSTTAAPTPGGEDLARTFGQLISRVETSRLPAAIKDGLLARLRSARDVVKAGSGLNEADFHGLIAEVLGALGRSGPEAPTDRPATTLPAVPDGDEHPDTDDSDGSFPRTTTAGSRPTGATGSTTTAGRPADPAKVGRQLDEWTARIDASTLSDADKATLRTAIDAVRASVLAGTLEPSDLGLLKATIAKLLKAIPSTSTTVGPETTDARPSAGAESSDPVPAERRRPKGRAAIAGAIETVTNSPLPEGLKQELLGVLTRAQAVLDDPSLTPAEAAEKLRELHRAEASKRLANALTKLTRFSEKIAGLAFTAGPLPGSGDVIAEVHAKLTEANALLAAGPIDIETAKAAWKLLHQARTLLQDFIESAQTSTTSAPTESTVASPEPSTPPSSAGD